MSSSAAARRIVGTRIVQRRQRLAPIEPEFASADVFERENVFVAFRGASQFLFGGRSVTLGKQCAAERVAGEGRFVVLRTEAFFQDRHSQARQLFCCIRIAARKFQRTLSRANFSQLQAVLTIVVARDFGRVLQQRARLFQSAARQHYRAKIALNVQCAARIRAARGTRKVQ